MRGFTLVELLVSIAVLGLTLALITTVLGLGLKAYRYGADRVEVQQDTRSQLEPIMRTIRNSAYVLEATDHSFEVMDPGGMRVVFSNPAARMTYTGRHDEPQELLRAHPGLIRSITVEIPPFLSTATLRNDAVIDPNTPTSWCAYGAYIPGGWNIMCAR